MKTNPAPFDFPKIILGTMTFGKQNTQEEAFEQLDWAFEQGIRFWDCAEMYPVPAGAETAGRTEEIIGNWLKAHNRDDIIIATKVAGPGRPFLRGGLYGKGTITTAIEGSLKRLGTDHVDLYQIHWPARACPVFGQTRFTPPEDASLEYSIREQLEEMASLIKAGKIRAVGLSNETPWGVSEFIKMSELHGLPRVVSTQNAFSLANRQVEQALDEVLWRENVAYLAYSPLAAGVLTGKYLKEGAIGRFTLFKGFSPRYTRPEVARAVARYCDIAARHGLTPEELALGFAAAHPAVTSVILGATSLTQLKHDVAACSVHLTPEIMAEIDQVHFDIPNPAI